MKKLVPMIFVLLTTFLSAQDFEWTQPQIITDTNSFYTHPFVAVYNDSAWLFYEKQEQHSSIYKMNLNDTENNVLLLGSESVNYQQPVFYADIYGDYYGRLFYLSDEEGFFNLYTVQLFENDSLGTPVKIVPNPADKSITDYFINTSDIITYTIDSMVYAAEIKITPDTVYTERNTLLDSASFNIKIDEPLVSWQKIENDSSHIKTSLRIFNPDSGAFFWQTPRYADTTGDCRWLAANHAVPYYGSNFLFWVKQDSVKGLYGYYPYVDTITIDTDSKPDVREITFLSWQYGVKRQLFDPYYLCFATGPGDSSEIYCVQMNDENVYLTNNDYPDDHPEIYFGELKSTDPGGGWTLWVYCIWQAHINGKAALAMSKNIATFTTSIKENHTVDKYIRVSPNPFHDNLKISINTSGKEASLAIFNIGGMEIARYSPAQSVIGWQHFTWHPSSTSAPGVYFIVLTTDGKKYVRKAILSN